MGPESRESEEEVSGKSDEVRTNPMSADAGRREEGAEGLDEERADDRKE
jgi:hypothetical protein